jgi:hypothetical protein
LLFSVWDKIRQYRFWLSVALGFVLLLLAFRDVELRQMIGLLGRVNPWPLGACLPLYALVLWLRSWRWKYFLRSQVETSANQLFSIVAIGYLANNLLPARLGDLARAWLVGEKVGVSKSAAFATVLVERLFDAVATLLLVAVLLPFLVLPKWVGQGLVGIAIVVAIVATLAIILVGRSQRSASLFRRQLTWTPILVRERLSGMASRFVEGLAILQRPTDAALAVLSSIAIWSAVGAIYYAVTIAMPVSASFPEVLLVAALVNVAAVVPSPPSQLGAFEFAAVMGFGLLAAAPDEATIAALTVVTHSMLFIPAVVIGFVCLWREGQPISLFRRRQLSSDIVGSSQSTETFISPGP